MRRENSAGEGGRVEGDAGASRVLFAAMREILDLLRTLKREYVAVGYLKEMFWWYSVGAPWSSYQSQVWYVIVQQGAIK